MDNSSPAPYFQLLTEVTILEQLSRNILEEELPDGFIAPHFGVISHLIRVKDGPTPLDLARAFQVPKTSMTHTLAGLAKHGLVEMRPNPADGRSKQVWLLAKGQQLHAETVAAMGPKFADISKSVSLEEVQQTLPILAKLRAYLDEARS